MVKTGRQIQLYFGQCSIRNRKKSMIVSDYTIKVEGIGDFFKNMGKIILNVSKKWQKTY